MHSFEFTINNDTFRLNDTTKYRFNNNICNHSFLSKPFSVLICYQHDDYYMFFLLASYSSDCMDPQETEEAYWHGVANLDTMYFFESEHAFVNAITLIESQGEIKCFAKRSVEGLEDRELLEIDKCLGIYKHEDGVLSLVYNSYEEAFDNAWLDWKSPVFGILKASP